MRHRASRQSGAGTARDDRHAARMAELQNRRDLCARLGQYDAQRRGTERRQPVAFVGRRVLTARQDRARGQDPREFAQQLGRRKSAV
jgi:hypothetical protein